MAAKSPRPFPIQMEVEFLDRLSEPVRDGKAKSVSEIIRTALEQYDFSDVLVLRPSHLLISVRLPVELHRSLRKTARTKHTSVGHLVRAAVEAYLPELEARPMPEAPAKPARKRSRRRKRRVKQKR
jgi:predicted DNA-binding protein